VGVVEAFEGRVESQREWVRLFHGNASDVDALLNIGALSPSANGELELNYVGIAVFEKALLVAQPKVFFEVESLPLHRLLEVLRTYFARSVSRRGHQDPLRIVDYANAEIAREFDTMHQLRDWFNAHGIYRHLVARRRFHGRPNWGRTLAKQAPLIVQGTPVYPRVESDQRQDVLNEISKLQVSVTSLLSQRYGLPVPPDWAGYGRVLDEWPPQPESRQYLLRRLAVEKRDQFRTDSLRLLSLLTVALDSGLARRARRPAFFGTTAFYGVWEDACRVLCGGPLRPDLLLHQPRYVIPRAGKTIEIALQQRPDILVDRGSETWLMDAKYYFPFPLSYPGTPDVVKQIHYAESAKSVQPVRSMFLLPHVSAAGAEQLGHIESRGTHREFGRIEVWGIDPHLALNSYTQGEVQARSMLFSRFSSATSSNL
jgi:hypothetical protein